MTNEAFYTFMKILNNFFCEIPIPSSSMDENVLREFVSGYIALLSGMDDEIYSILKDFFLKNEPSHGISREMTDMLLEYIRYGSNDYQN